MGQRFQTNTVFHLGKDGKIGKSKLCQRIAHLLQITAAAHKGLHHRRDTVGAGNGKVGKIRLAHGGSGDIHIGKSDALVPLHQAAADAAAHGGSAVRLFHRQLNGAVIQQDGLSCVQRGENIRIQLYTAASEDEVIACAQRDRGIQLPQPQLTAPQVDDQLGGYPHCFSRLLQGGSPLAALLQRAVGYIQTEARETEAQHSA